VAEVNVVPLVAARVAAWRPVAERDGVELTARAAGEAPVRAATGVIEQALDALIDNAVKFAGADARVVVAVRPRPPDWVDVHVIDNGPGMPADDLRRAAEPFWRRPGHQNVAGSGLGVAIAHALVTASGGELELMAVEPHGVDARIRLPAATPPPGANGSGRGPTPGAHPGRPAGIAVGGFGPHGIGSGGAGEAR
jgi:signal transduction histidine kinase